ncbi:MAG: phospholipase D-like domain-containing protein [Acidimicrobiales bacterium]
MDTSRLTAAVVVDLIDAAHQELLIVSYATHPEPRIAEAIAGAIARGVDVTLLVERNADNPGFTGFGDAFADLDLRRLTWPAAVRPQGAALHPKLIVVDAEREAR